VDNGSLSNGVVAGVLETLAMDSVNLLFARTGMFLEIDVGDDCSDGCWLYIWTLPIWVSKRDEKGHKRGAVPVYLTLCHRREPSASVCARLRSIGRGACISDMGPCLWHRDDRSRLLSCLFFYGIGSTWQAFSRKH
jgi:hypothetical protein